MKKALITGIIGQDVSYLAEFLLDRRLGITTIFDHSIAHPALLEVLVNHAGQFSNTRLAAVGGFWAEVLEGIARADGFLLNLHFATKIFEIWGFDPSEMNVCYQDVEDEFLQCPPSQSAPYSSYFTGSYDRVKAWIICNRRWS